MRTLAAACVAFLAMTSPGLGEALPGGVQLAADISTAQQQQLDEIYAAAETAARGKSEAQRKDLFRATMPQVIAVLRPDARTTAYGKLYQESADIRQAGAQLGSRMGFDTIDFYP